MKTDVDSHVNNDLKLIQQPTQKLAFGSLFTYHLLTNAKILWIFELNVNCRLGTRVNFVIKPQS